MRFTSRMMLLAALLTCSACANQSTTNADLTSAQQQQFSSIHWDDAISASHAAVVTNGKLIFMR